ncbi:hypothetical protein TWF281_003821 [Arthrobotrys megalospora]
MAQTLQMFRRGDSNTNINTVLEDGHRTYDSGRLHDLAPSPSSSFPMSGPHGNTDNRGLDGLDEEPLLPGSGTERNFDRQRLAEPHHDGNAVRNSQVDVVSTSASSPRDRLTVLFIDSDSFLIKLPNPHHESMVLQGQNGADAPTYWLVYPCTVLELDIPSPAIDTPLVLESNGESYLAGNSYLPAQAAIDTGIPEDFLNKSTAKDPTRKQNAGHFQDVDLATALQNLNTNPGCSISEIATSPLQENQSSQSPARDPGVADDKPYAPDNLSPTTAPKTASNSAPPPRRRRSSATSSPISRQAGRSYPINRQRKDLKDEKRQRIVCGIDDCMCEFSDYNGLRRHRKNTHLSESQFCAQCLYPKCSAERWAGTEHRAWDNLKIHQNKQHSRWGALSKAKEERCRITKHPKHSRYA